MSVASLSGRIILNSRGEETIEAAIVFANGKSGKASVPAGKSTGKAEAIALPARAALAALEEKIAPRKADIPAGDIARFDEWLIALDGTQEKRVLGANTLLALSVAHARACAAQATKELWEELFAQFGSTFYPRPNMPFLYANLINGGLHAGGSIDFQEYLVIPRIRNIEAQVALVRALYEKTREILIREKGSGAVNVGDEGGFAPPCKDNLEPFAILQEAREALGARENVHFGLDAAGSNVPLSPDEMRELYHTMTERFGLMYLEDPFDEDAIQESTALRASLGDGVVLCGDDLTVTQSERIELLQARGAISGVIIKPNQVGTLTEALRAAETARRLGLAIICSHRSGETNDTWIADLAYMLGADGFKLGAPCRGERVAKYNRLLDIHLQTMSD